MGYFYRKGNGLNMIICYREDCIYNYFSKENNVTECMADVVTITEDLICDEYVQKDTKKTAIGTI